MKYPSIYIFCNNKDKNLQDDIVCLAQGFREIGISFYSNNNYWKENLSDDSYLIKKTPHISAYDCDIIIYPYNWFYWINEDKGVIETEITEELKKYNGIKVCIDCHDSYRSFSFAEKFSIFDYIFRAKMNRKCYHPLNHYPWQHGLTNRVISYVKNDEKFDLRKFEILWNFGASHPYAHGLRTLAQQKIRPQLQKIININTDTDDLKKEPDDEYENLMWKQSVRRHNKHYYQRLKEYNFCATFCGEMIPGLPFDPSAYMVGGGKAKVKRHIYELFSNLMLREERIIQWDSWRFWEALAAGCIPIHVDLEKYGVLLPEMPKNWVHYIGIDLDNIERDVNKIFSSEVNLEDISRKGKDWVMKNYSPKATAKRLLTTLGYEFD